MIVLGLKETNTLVPLNTKNTLIDTRHMFRHIESVQVRLTVNKCSLDFTQFQSVDPQFILSYQKIQFLRSWLMDLLSGASRRYWECYSCQHRAPTLEKQI